jgi:hypothetical protein
VGGRDCLCGGSGRIYDYNPHGDPCPECTGGRFTVRGQAGYQVDKVKMQRGCVVVALAILGGFGGLVWTVVEVLG